jgi:hypothetical protein
VPPEPRPLQPSTVLALSRSCAPAPPVPPHNIAALDAVRTTAFLYFGHRMPLAVWKVSQPRRDLTG